MAGIAANRGLVLHRVGTRCVEHECGDLLAAGTLTAEIPAVGCSGRASEEADGVAFTQRTVISELTLCRSRPRSSYGQGSTKQQYKCFDIPVHKN